MIIYSSPVRLEWANKRLRFVTLGRFEVWQKGCIIVTIPEGFETDLASIPGIVTPLIPKLGHHLQPAVVHDYMYVNKIEGINKKFADKFFYKSMLDQGVPRWRAWSMYLAVRVGGKGRWAK